MRNLTIILLAISLFAFSCEEIEEIIPTETSFEMIYDGVTYTEVQESTLAIVSGAMIATGTGTDELSLAIVGIGEDGTTTPICLDTEACGSLCTVALTFSDASGKGSFGATTGTIKRTGKTIEINVDGFTATGASKTLTATIKVSSVLDI